LSLLNCLAAAIPARERVVTCEEVFELPVIENHRLVGMISEADLAGNLPSTSSPSSSRRSARRPDTCWHRARRSERSGMRLERFTFGSIRIDGVTYEHDVVIDRGKGSRAQQEAVEGVVRQVEAGERRTGTRMPGPSALGVAFRRAYRGPAGRRSA
jgi:hypothetical protein